MHDSANDRTRLKWVLALTLAYTAAEVAGGIASNSLALLADAGHMATDDLALGLAVLAGWFARRPPDRGRTFGYQRAGVLAAFVNALFLVGVALFICYEGYDRIVRPVEVSAGAMIAVGFIALGGVAAEIGVVIESDRAHQLARR